MQRDYLIYKDIADEHSPLMYFLLLIVQPLVPNSLEAAKLTLALLIGIIALLTLWTGYKSGGWLAGTFSVLFFALWSPIFGYGKLWHETFLAPLYLLILWRVPTLSRPNVCSSFVGGLLCGIALLTKQHAIVVALGFILWRSFTSWRNHCPIRYLLTESLLFLTGISLPTLTFTIYYWYQTGTLKDLVFWLIVFNFINRYTQLASLWPSSDQIRVLAPAYVLLLPFITNLLGQRCQKDIHKAQEELGLVLLVSSSLTIYPRFGFFHLQTSLPILAWLSGTTLARLAKTRCGDSIPGQASPLLRGLACSFVLLWVFYAGMPYYKALFSKQPRKIYEYSDLVPLANEIRQHIGPVDCIYILPDDEATANLYYLTQCQPPKPWVPTSYPWFMIDAVKPRIVRTLEETSPKWVIYFPGRWGIEQHGQELLTYVQSNYQLEAKMSWAEGEVWLLKRTSP